MQHVERNCFSQYFLRGGIIVGIRQLTENQRFKRGKRATRTCKLRRTGIFKWIWDLWTCWYAPILASAWREFHSGTLQTIRSATRKISKADESWAAAESLGIITICDMKHLHVSRSVSSWAPLGAKIILACDPNGNDRNFGKIWFMDHLETRKEFGY